MTDEERKTWDQITAEQGHLAQAAFARDASQVIAISELIQTLAEHVRLLERTWGDTK